MHAGVGLGIAVRTEAALQWLPPEGDNGGVSRPDVGTAYRLWQRLQIVWQET
jgi:hypothetical protein